MAINVLEASALIGILVIGCTGAGAQRSVPAPMAGHPGNVFLVGEKITVTLPTSDRG